MPGVRACTLGLRLDLPPSSHCEELTEVTPWSVESEALGDFYNTIFDEWIRRDVGRVYIMNFEWMLYAWLGGQGPICYLNSRCGNCIIIEHNGDVYSCDHYVYPEFKLGNVLSDQAASLIASPKQQEWGRIKERTLPESCRECEVGGICRGGCPKHRFAKTYLGEPGQNYLCAGYKTFYTHTRKYMQGMAKLAELGVPCDTIMEAIDHPVMIPARNGWNEHTDAFLLKVNSNGTLAWNKIYNSTYESYVYSVVATSDGGYALAGNLYNYDTDNNNMYLIKTNANGIYQWNQTYGNTDSDYAYAVIQAKDGSYVLAGYTSSSITRSYDALLVKAYANGTQEWRQTIGGSAAERARAVVATPDGGYVLAGYINAPTTSYDVYLVKVPVTLELGLAQVSLTTNTITIYRGADDTYWQYVRVKVWT
jgi:radical SAM protein with 4Fe4S-binding SPASM domain